MLLDEGAMAVLLAPVNGALLSSAVDEGRSVHGIADAVGEFPVADNKLLGITVKPVEEVSGRKTVEESACTVFDKPTELEAPTTVLSVDCLGTAVELIVGLPIKELDALTIGLSVAWVGFAVELILRLPDNDGEKSSFMQSARTDVKFSHLLSHPGNDSFQTNISAADWQSNMDLTIPGDTSLPS
jgi:hypothetical protein